ncbi:MAG: hypothetical protein KBS66_03785, partial [Eubacterium sp.]|nr:hypothetical protein [Candidatus Colimonas fimequi]
FDGWKYDIREKDKGGCTVIGKEVDGKMVVARNMDMSISHMPAYYFRTDLEGCNKTICVMYTNFLGETSDVIRRNGISNAMLEMLPISAADSMNDKGFYVEANMRTTENYEDGTSKFGSSGTNPDSDIRLALSQLPVYLPLHCDTVDEALKMVREDLDIYSLNSDLIDWPLCLYMADATGNYGVLEVVNNEIIWHDKAPAQANFYLDEKYQQIEDYKAGFGKDGRYETAIKGREAAETPEDMWNAIDKVTYYQVYDLDNCKFDPRTEYTGHDICGVEGMPTNWTTDVVLDENNRPALEKYIRQNGKKVMGMTRDEQADKNEYWESVYTILANCTDKTMKIRFFEDDERTIELGFDE